MSHQLDRIILTEQVQQYTMVNADDFRVLSPISRINVLVGANNSGKSRFMRALVNFKNFPSVSRIQFPQAGDSQERDAARVLRSFFDLAKQRVFQFGFVDIENTLSTLSKIETAQKVGNAWMPQFWALLRRIRATKSAKFWNREESQPPSDEAGAANNILRNLVNDAENHHSRFVSAIKQDGAANSFKSLYVPTLRTLRLSGSNTLERQTRDDYFKNVEAEIFTGESLYQEIQNLLLGNLEERKTVRLFEKFISDQFFNGQPLALIPKLKCKTLEVKIGTEKEYPIQNLGDGIQSILVLTFPLFRHREEPMLVFYEEPEMFMHPGIQRVFLNALQKFENHQFFLTTHSNHFLDITLDLKDVSVFVFRKKLDDSADDEKEAQFEIENVSSGNHSCLELLGVRNSSVFLSNCTIWVEGITDRRYLAHYLKLYTGQHRRSDASSKEFKEDLHYSFVEYGGANITHWSFLDDVPDPINVDRLCSRLFLITDKDSFNSGAKSERLKRLENALHERFYSLRCKEIENLLEVHVLKQVVAFYEDGEEQFNEVKRSDYAKEPLGQFIEDKLLAKPKTRRGSYATDSGTVSDKVNFCDKAIAAMASYDDLSNEAKEIAKRLYEFISKNN